MNPLRETGLVVERELRRNFRGVRAMALYALTLLGGLVSTLVGALVHNQVIKAKDSYGTEIVKSGAEALYTILYRNDAIVAERLTAAPSTIVVTAWAAVWLCPLLVAIIGFDALSSERQHRTLRYMTVRVRRPSYFVGKWLGLWLSTSIVLLGVELISWLCDLGLVHSGAGEVFTWGPALFAVAVPILGAWCAVATFMGSFAKTPMIALFLILGAFTVLFIVGNLPLSETPWSYLAYCYPGSFDHLMLRSGAEPILKGLGAALAYPVLFVGLGAFLFERSEV